MDLAVKKRLTELDAANSLTEEGHLEIAVLLTWSEFKRTKKAFEKETVKSLLKASSAFENFCEHMFSRVWNQVKRFFDEILSSKKPEMQIIPGTGYEAYS